MGFFFGGGSLGTSIDSSEIVDGSIVNADVNASAAIAASKLDLTGVTSLASLETVGTITTGVWTGTTIAVANGGTGQTSYTDGQLLIGNTTGNTLAKSTLAVGTNGGVVIANGSGTITLDALAVQQIRSSTTTMTTGTTTIPTDDTIPQNTEGDEILTATITPKKTDNILKIDVSIVCSSSLTNAVVAALFQDTTANAIYATWMPQVAGAGAGEMSFTYYMTAGTVSATTIKLRTGPSTAATLTINGASGSRFFGGSAQTSLIITELDM